MFSGIVEESARVVALNRVEDNLDISLACSFVEELSIDQSVSHNGVCLTVVRLPKDDTYTVTAIRETLDRSNLGSLKVGDEVNVERSMRIDGRLDGHIVQGHVDQTAKCVDLVEADGSWVFTFEYQVSRDLARRGYFTVDKGSVTVNGVSLTVCNPTSAPAADNPDMLIGRFSVAIIPYTFHNTNFHNIRPGSIVNLEFDILGKYIARLSSL
ncbi:MAG: riboflavin synthase [Lepagella sp.]